MIKSQPQTLPENHDNAPSSHRKSLIERLASLRIIHDSRETTNALNKSPESPRYIPPSRNALNSSKSNLSNAKNPTLNQSPTQPATSLIGRRRKLASNIAASSVPSPIGTCSPKCFPKKLIYDEHDMDRIAREDAKSPILSAISQKSSTERKHRASGAVNGFIESFDFLANFLSRSDSRDATLHLQNMNSSFVALQRDLKAAVSSIMHSSPHDTKDLEDQLLASQTNEEELKEKLKLSISNEQELKDQLDDKCSQLIDAKTALEKEKANVEFLQNYMEEIMQLKDDAEKRIGELEREVLELRKKSTDSSGDSSNLTTVNQKQEDLIQQKNVEIEKLRSREKHFKESNEIFQQKLQILTEENRKLRGQRPLNSL